MTNKIIIIEKLFSIFFQLFITESSFSNNIENFIVKGNKEF